MNEKYSTEMRKAFSPPFRPSKAFTRQCSARLLTSFCLTIFVGLVIARLLLKPTRNLPFVSGPSFYDTILCGYRDWWDCPQKLPPDQRAFNKSILYLKPHKTGSESFKEILIHIGEYYNLTTDKELDSELLNVRSTPERRKLLRNQYDILLRHSRYRKDVTEKRIRGWVEGQLAACGPNCAVGREVLRIVTIRDPIDRLFSHYFSKRRFRTFTPSRGFVRPGRLSEEEEIKDFEEWLEQYKASQQLVYNGDLSLKSQGFVSGQELFDGVGEVVGFYDHVIVTEHWKQSLCLFGFVERIHPSLLSLKNRNANGRRAHRFRESSVLANRDLFAKIVSKIEYDFLLHQALLRKFHKNWENTESEEMRRYCQQVED